MNNTFLIKLDIFGCIVKENSAIIINAIVKCASKKFRRIFSMKNMSTWKMDTKIFPPKFVKAPVK